MESYKTCTKCICICIQLVYKMGALIRQISVHLNCFLRKHRPCLRLCLRDGYSFSLSWRLGDSIMARSNSCVRENPKMMYSYMCYIKLGALIRQIFRNSFIRNCFLRKHSRLDFISIYVTLSLPFLKNRWSRLVVAVLTLERVIRRCIPTCVILNWRQISVHLNCEIVS